MNPPFVVDLNCDMGESFGAYQLGQDAAILPYVTSANIACGFHAGDPAVMKQTVRLALQQGVALGAHPGLPDLAGFGRREMAISPEEAYDMVVYQMGALAAFVRAEGGQLHHLKPHGALYNMAAGNAPLAEAIAEAVYRVDPALTLYGLAGSALIRAGEKLGLKTCQEVFADRTYQADGTLTPRRQPQALITDHREAARQVVGMIKTGTVLSLTGQAVAIQADTVCIHGDGPQALAFARHLREVLQSEGILVRSGAKQVPA
jgi:5-oxoprolinase (ATP-hydrolysing) subunit A